MNLTTAPSTPDEETLRFAIGGMTCASCVARVEKALKKVPGVVSAEVNLATETATVKVIGAIDAAARRDIFGLVFGAEETLGDEPEAVNRRLDGHAPTPLDGVYLLRHRVQAGAPTTAGGQRPDSARLHRLPSSRH